MKQKFAGLFFFLCLFLFSCSAHTTKLDNSSDELNRLMVEMPELVTLKEGLPKYYIHVTTHKMPPWNNTMEAFDLSNELQRKIDPNAKITSRPYGRSVKYTVYYGPFFSKIEVARMAKKIKDSGYLWYVKFTPKA